MLIDLACLKPQNARKEFWQTSGSFHTRQLHFLLTSTHPQDYLIWHSVQHLLRSRRAGTVNVAEGKLMISRLFRL